MRAFLVLFFALLGTLCAQDKVDFAKFEKDFRNLQGEIVLGKYRSIYTDKQWVENSRQRLQRLQIAAQQILAGSESEEIKQKVIRFTFDVTQMINDLRFISKRIAVKSAVEDLSMENLDDEMAGVKTLLDQFKGGLKFDFQPQQVQKAFFSLQIVKDVLDDSKFTSRVCKNDVEVCLEKLEKIKKTVAEQIPEIKQWMKEANIQ